MGATHDTNLTLEELKRSLVLALPHTIDATHLSKKEGLTFTLGPKIPGKVRDSYLVYGNDNREPVARLLFTTDRVSAFDCILGTLPLKGQFLNHVANHFFQTTQDVIPNHLLAVLDESCVLVKPCKVFSVEFVVRAYLTGVTSTSIWTHYKNGGRAFCGHKLPEGLKKNDPLPEPILTPTTKPAYAEGAGHLHDENISAFQILEQKLMSEAHFNMVQDKALALFAKGQMMADKQGLILADTKYEMGLTSDGTLILVDEVHTPDSSRYWVKESYHARHAQGLDPISLDKEYLRTWLKNEGFSGNGTPPTIPDDIRVEASLRYAQATTMVSGTPLIPNTAPQHERESRVLDRLDAWMRSEEQQAEHRKNELT